MLVCCDEVCHCLNLRVVFVAIISDCTILRRGLYKMGRQYGFVSWEEKGSMLDSISMFARTKYFRTWIRWRLPASSKLRKDSKKSF